MQLQKMPTSSLHKVPHDSNENMDQTLMEDTEDAEILLCAVAVCAGLMQSNKNRGAQGGRESSGSRTGFCAEKKEVTTV